MNRNRNVKNGKSKDQNKVQSMNKKKYTRNNSSKNQRRMKEAIDAELSTTNDFSWYDKNSAFTADAARLGFSTPLGARIQLNDTDYVCIAGVMQLVYSPTVGYSKDLSSPINRRAFELYNYLRGNMKAAASYDAADVMIHFMAFDSLYSYWSLMRRAYGVALLYTPMNKYYPRTLLTAMGFNPNIADNLAEFRAYINKFALSLSSFFMPASFDITARHMWMNNGLYLDSSTTRAQTYIFTPLYFWSYDNTVTTGSQLIPKYWMDSSSSPTMHTLDEVIAFGNSLLQNVVNDQDSINISGDLYRAYEGKGITLEFVDEQYRILPVFDTTVLSQIENATVVGIPITSDTSNPFVISQNPTVNNGAIVFQPKWNGQRIAFSNGNVFFPQFSHADQFINMHVDSPTTEQVMEATRLMATTSQPSESVLAGNDPASVGVNLDILPADVINYIGTVRFNPNTYPAYNFLNTYTSTVLCNTSGNWISSGAGTTVVQDVFEKLSMWAQFDWAPMQYIMQKDGTSTTVSVGDTFNVIDVCADLDNATLITARQLGDLHEAALWSMFEVPKPNFNN